MIRHAEIRRNMLQMKLCNVCNSHYRIQLIPAFSNSDYLTTSNQAKMIIERNQSCSHLTRIEIVELGLEAILRIDKGAEHVSCLSNAITLPGIYSLTELYH